MTENRPYSLENGKVHFTDSQGHLVVSFPDTEMIGVAFDDVEGILHKHGRESLVTKWADDARKKFLNAGFDEMVKEIAVISFPATPETIRELNACIAISGRVKDIVERLSNLGPKTSESAANP